MIRTVGAVDLLHIHGITRVLYMCVSYSYGVNHFKLERNNTN